MIYTSIILVAHFVADFLCQPRRWAKEKHRSIKALVKHVAIYTYVIMIIVGGLTVQRKEISLNLICIWAILNGIMHLVVDYVTSRLFHKYWTAGKEAAAINVYGFDQFLHVLCLLGTFGNMP